MGCNFSSLSDFALDQEDISNLLKKPQNELTEEEKEKVQQYLSNYEPILNRLDTILTDIDKRLDGKDDVPEYNPSLDDIAIVRLKSTMKNLKNKLIKLENESQHYLQLAKENKGNESIYKMHLKYVAQCRKSADVIANRLGSLEDKLIEIQNAGHTLNTLLLMNDVADNLESMQKVISSSENYEDIFDRVNELDENLTDLNVVIQGELDEDPLESYMEEVDAMLDKEAKEELQLPNVPTIQHDIPEKVETVIKERVAVAVLEEFCVCFYF